jgi:hypothetical protein
MTKTAAAVLLLAATLGAATPLASQTRPRRVTQVSQTPEEGYSESQPRAAAPRPRTVADAGRPEGERRGRRWPGTLLRVGITAAVIGATTRGHGSCTPSRGHILGLPGHVPR